MECASAAWAIASYDGGTMKPVYFATPLELRTWFEEHHLTAVELLVGFHKRATKKASITWPESVDEALSFGWIDGVRKSLGDNAYTIRFTPRRPKSIWSAINVARVAELTKQGRMREAGLRAYAARTPERTGVYSFERHEAAKLSPAHEKLLCANKKAHAFFEAQPPGYRKVATHWITSAKRDETRDRRLAQLIEHSAAGRRIPQVISPKKKS
jgi:uncharacterized protein YdeI (YjbR/CyaY-like superfamily)